MGTIIQGRGWWSPGEHAQNTLTTCAGFQCEARTTIRTNYRTLYYFGEDIRKALLATAVAASILSGCASVPMESKAKADMAKQFNTPAAGKSGLYIYRSGSLGGALKKDVWLDGKCIGETAPNVFFYEEVKGDSEHTVSTESEFSPNDLVIKTEAGINYFIKQYIKLGVFVGGAGLELVDENEGKSEVKGLKMATKGTCSK